MNKRNSVLLVLVLIGLLFAGFVFLQGDPFSSKTASVGNDNIQNPTPYISPFSPAIYTDNFDGANDTTALKARGYKVWYRGTGPQGLTATWFQGNSIVFNAFNGPATGYVAANYNVVTGVNNIDSWLVLPYMSGGLQTGDSLYFYSRSPTGSTFPDSIRVMVSAGDSIPEGTWTELGRFKVSTAGTWQLKGFRSSSSGGNARFAIRYNVVGGGPSGNNSDFIGIDALTIVRTGGSTLAMPDQWCSNFPPVTGSGELWGHASCTLGDTLYVAGGGAASTASTTFYKYSIHGNSWSTGAPMPGAKTGGDLVQCGGKIYYVGGGASISVGNGLTYCYTPANGTWTTVANQPTLVTGCVAESYQDSIIYCMMGGWASYLTTIQVYRPGSNTWTTATAFTGNGRRSFSGGITGNILFVACGYNGTYLNTFYTGTINPSNPLQITWSAKTNSRWTASRSGGTAIAGKFYVCPGDTGTGIASGGIGIWDTTTNAWTYVYGDPFLASNYWGAMSSSFVNCGGVLGIKIWRVAGSLAATTRPLIVFADTCLTGCDVVTGTVTHNNNTVPQDYVLHQNYPNPFNPSTKILFEIPKSGNVKLVVYDILGREVASLLNDFKAAGRYTAEFDASNLASGVYLYRLEAGTFTQTKKMLLIK